MGDLHDLFDLHAAPDRMPWIDRISPEARGWCERLAELIVETGRPPTNWVEALRRFKAECPGEAPLYVDTFRKTIRRLVGDRANV